MGGGIAVMFKYSLFQYITDRFRSELARAERGVVNRPYTGMSAMIFEHHDSPASHLFLTGGG